MARERGDRLRADRAHAFEVNNVSRETSDRLDRLVELLLTWQASMNLIGPSTIDHIWTRHVADSLQLLELAPNARVWIDLGTGAGFPGLVIACALKDRDGAQIHLVDKSSKKGAFLNTAIRTLDIPAVVHIARIEDFVQSFSDSVDVVTARALAPLPRLLGYVAPLIERGAQALLLKGQDVEAELTEASKCWNIRATLAPSRTNPRARILIVNGLERHDDRESIKK